MKNRFSNSTEFCKRDKHFTSLKVLYCIVSLVRNAILLYCGITKYKYVHILIGVSNI